MPWNTRARTWPDCMAMLPELDENACSTALTCRISPCSRLAYREREERQSGYAGACWFAWRAIRSVPRSRAVGLGEWSEIEPFNTGCATLLVDTPRPVRQKCRSGTRRKRSSHPVQECGIAWSPGAAPGRWIGLVVGACPARTRDGPSAPGATEVQILVRWPSDSVRIAYATVGEARRSSKGC